MKLKMLHFFTYLYYWGTGKKRKHLFVGRKPVLALTPTADKDMRKRLMQISWIKDHKEVSISPNKETIRVTVT